MYLKASASRAAMLLARNPRLFGRVLLAKVNATRPMPKLPARRRIRGVLIEYDLPDYSSVAAMYFGACSLLVIEAMKRYLRPGDTFVDVGANIGYLSAAAAGLVGRQGQIHCFEPVPAYCARVRRLAELNPEYSIVVNACAAGDSDCSRAIYVTRAPGQSTLVGGYKNGAEVVSVQDIPVVRLDTYLATHQTGRLALIKIDAEGFELPILQGLRGFFEKAVRLPAIICEIAPRAYPLMGRKLSDLSAFMLQYGYKARDLIDSATPIDLASLKHVEDVLFLAGC
jgi:FkbM family methyltransferase